MRRGIAKLLLVLAVVTGCAAKKDYNVLGGPEQELLQPVGLVPSVLLQDLPGALAEGEDPFFAGIFVGNLVHSGGYYLAESDGEGAPARSLNYAFNAHEEYSRYAKDFLDKAVADELTREKVAWSRMPAAPEGALPAPIRRVVRGSHPDDGTDNVNTPRYELEPTPLAGAQALGAGVSSYLVPIVALYYSHNGGWFVGQRMGSGGGARIRVLLVNYDAASGRVLTWRDIEARTIVDMVNNPNGAQLQDFLIATEAKMVAELQRGLVP